MLAQKKIGFIDIETSPCIATVWRSGKQVVPSCDILTHSKIICIAYESLDGKEKFCLSWDKNQCDKKMMEELVKRLEDVEVLVGHNHANFDIKHINTRIAAHRLKRLPLMTLDDTLRQSRRHFYLPSHKLEYLLRFFDLDTKLDTSNGLWKKVLFNNDAKALKYMMKYCVNDVSTQKKLWLRMYEYVDHTFNVRHYTKNAIRLSCQACGGKLKTNGTRTTATQVYKRLRCTKCGRSDILNKRDEKLLLKEGKLNV